MGFIYTGFPSSSDGKESTYNAGDPGLTPWTVAHLASLSVWNYPGKNTGVGTHSFLQGIFSTWGSNPGLLHYRWILYHLSY